MNELLLFVIGAVVFAVAVYGAVVAGGLALTRSQLEQDEQLAERVDPEDLASGLPTNVRY